MKINKLLSIALIALTFEACTTDATNNNVPQQQTSEQKIINTTENAYDNTLLVKLHAYTDTFALEIDGEDVDCRPLFSAGNTPEATLKSEELYRWWALSFDNGENIAKLAKRVAEDERVQYVEFNERLEHIGEDYSGEEAGGHVATRATQAEMPFNDEWLCEQWHYYNDGKVYGDVSSDHTPGADINLFPAWKYCTGDNRVIVAVIDGGVKYNHPDLAANMWVNQAEANGSMGIDDDMNGYVDDIYGYNFNDLSGNITFDDHGTHVAGTIAAVSNNGIGVAGIAGGSGKGDGCRIMTCQIYKNGTATSTYDIAAAIKYAADNGAVIINNSWQYAKGSYTSDSRFRQNYSVLMDAIEYFESNAKLPGVIDGGICIFAAGNDAYNVPSYPGAYYSNICVTAFGPNFTAGSYTNYGAGANICAPGGENTSWATKICSTSVSYEVGYERGTSMAAPHVSGCAALGLSYALKIGKSFTREEFQNLILSSVHDIDQYQTVRTGAFDFDTGTYPTVNIEYYKGQLGAGYIDAHLLLMQVEGTACIYIATGKQQSVSLDNHFGDGSERLTYTNVEMSATEMAKLGITTTPTIVDGKLQIKCTKSGTARMSITAIVGGTVVGGGDNMGGMEVTREFEIVARQKIAENGGWL